MSPHTRVVVVGRGRVGTALGAALGRAGLEAELVSSRALPAELHAAIYVLAVRDPALDAAARAVIARHRGDAPVLLHTAGGVPSAVLREAGAVAAAVMHPLRAFASGAAVELAGTLFAIEGEGAGRVAAEALVAALGGRALVLDATRLARYHAAAVLASNHVLALVDVAQALLEGLGVEHDVAARAVADLFSGVASNLAEHGLPRALTGPIARGDGAAVARHLEALRGAPEARAVYLSTAMRLVQLAREKGEADPAGLQAIEQLLTADAAQGAL